MMKKSKTITHLFCLNTENYISLLCSFLSKHGKTKFQVTECKMFSFKILCPPAKEKVNAINVNNFAEFEKLATKIVEKKIFAISVFIDMKDV
jgi:hypothetical protein